MAKRMILMLAVTVAVVAGLGFVKYRQIEAAIKAGASYQPPPQAVTTIIARQEVWPSTMKVIGTAAAIQGVTVSADLPGTVAKINFESGKWVHQGDVLVELDTRQERAQLAEMEAQRDLAQINFGRMKQLAKEGVVARTEYDNAVAQQKATQAQVGEIRATIDRKTILAPFSGVLGIRQVNLGQYLAAGAPVVSLQALNPIYVNFGIPQQDAAAIGVGRKLRVTSDSLPSLLLAGQVTAMDSVVSESTRNIQVQGTLRNPEGKVRPGMFLQVEVVTGASHSVITLPASAINYAPYGDSVFVVSEMKDPKGKSYRGVHQEFVKIEGSRGDQVGIASGINPGDEVVTSGVFKLRNGAAVLINNTVQPENNPSPHPKDS